MMGVRQPTGGKVPRRRSVTREQLIVAAEACFLERGFQGSSVEWVAAEAGYTPGAIYSSFGDKAGLFMAVLDRRNQAQWDAWRTAGLAPDPARSVAKMLEDQLKDAEWVRWSSAYYEFYAFAVREPEIMARFKAMFHRGGKEIEAALAGLTPAPQVRPDEFVQLVRAASRGLALVALLEEETDVSGLMRTLLAVLCPATSEPAAEAAVDADADVDRDGDGTEPR